MGKIVYNYGDKVYLNITNKCPCRCTFCIRDNMDGLGDAESLWHEKDPSLDEIKKAIDDFDITNSKEIVFCGYGEPTNALDTLIATSKYVREVNPNAIIRLNTNGLSNLINGRSTEKEIGDAVDSISISLNQPTSEEYDAITRNRFPGKAFQGMLDFTKEATKYCDDVRMTVVDVIGEENVEKSRKICESLGAKFRCRTYEA